MKYALSTDPYYVSTYCLSDEIAKLRLKYIGRITSVDRMYCAMFFIDNDKNVYHCIFTIGLLEFNCAGIVEIEVGLGFYFSDNDLNSIVDSIVC